MKNISQLWIGGTRWAVRHDTVSWWGGGESPIALGSCDARQHTITVFGKQSPEGVRATLLHEALHAFEEVACDKGKFTSEYPDVLADLSRTKEMCETFACRMSWVVLAVLRDPRNAELTRFLLGDDSISLYQYTVADCRAEGHQTREEWDAGFEERKKAREVKP